MDSDGCGVMALFDKDEATALRELFAGMDDADAAEAATAMAATAELLRRHDYSFRDIVEEIDARGLLLPTKVGAAIRLMDSTTLSEAASAFTGARRLMRNCGLTFAGIIGALDRDAGDNRVTSRSLKLAYKDRGKNGLAELEAEPEQAALEPSSRPLVATGPEKLKRHRPPVRRSGIS